MLNTRDDIIDLFEKGIFPYKGNVFKTKEHKQEEEQEETITDIDKFSKYIAEKETDIDKELFKNYFKFQRPSDMLKSLYKANTSQNNELISLINSGLKDLKEEIKKMSKEEIENEKPDEIVRVVEMILDFNKQNQQGKGLKILTPNQMLSRLPIALAQLKAGNNSEKLKNEIRQLLYFLYRSLTKQLYKSLVGI